MATLEEIATEFNKGGGIRDPVVLLDLINQHYLSRVMPTLSHLDGVETVHVTRSLGKILGVRRGATKLMQQKLAELGVFSLVLTDYSPEVQEAVIRGVIENTSTNAPMSIYLSPNNPYAGHNRWIITTSNQMRDHLRDYFSNLGVSCLDEIIRDHVAHGLANALGIRDTNSRPMQQKLAELNIFSLNLADYSPEVQESVIGSVIRNISTNKSSVYLSEENPYVELNRWIITTSNQMRDHLRGYFSNLGVHHLNDITEDHATIGLGKILGFRFGNFIPMQQKLAELGVFSLVLTDYSPEVQEAVIRGVIENTSTNAPTSIYLSPNNPYAEQNRRIIVASQQMRDYLRDYFSNLDVLHLNDVNENHVTRILAKILGVKRKNPRPARERLAELGISPQDLNDEQQKLAESGETPFNLADCAPKEQESMIEDIIANITSNQHLSAYLSSNNPHVESNRKIIAASQQMRDYLSSLGIYHLDDVTTPRAPQGLGNVIGYKQKNPKQMQQRLIELGLFSLNLTDYSQEAQGSIIEQIIENTLISRPTSVYLSSNNPYAEHNRRVITTSKQMKDHLRDYLSTNGILHLDDVKGEYVKESIGRVFGFKLKRSPGQMQQKLVELGLFSLNLADYNQEVQESVIRNAIENISTSFPSVYLSSSNPYTQTNRRIIAASTHMRDYLSRIGISKLDDVKVTDAKPGLGNLLDFKYGNPIMMRQRLVDLVLFPTNSRNGSYDFRFNAAPAR